MSHPRHYNKNDLLTLLGSQSPLLFHPHFKLLRVERPAWRITWWGWLRIGDLQFFHLLIFSSFSPHFLFTWWGPLRTGEIQTLRFFLLVFVVAFVDLPVHLISLSIDKHKIITIILLLLFLLLLLIIIIIFTISFTPVSDKLIPTGSIASVAGTVFDLRTPTRWREEQCWWLWWQERLILQFQKWVATKVEITIL